MIVSNMEAKGSLLSKVLTTCSAVICRAICLKHSCIPCLLAHTARIVIVCILNSTKKKELSSNAQSCVRAPVASNPDAAELCGGYSNCSRLGSESVLAGVTILGFVSS